MPVYGKDLDTLRPVLATDLSYTNVFVINVGNLYRHSTVYLSTKEVEALIVEMTKWLERSQPITEVITQEEPEGGLPF